MARRYWGMGWTPQEAIDAQEKVRAEILESAGATPEKLEGARRLLKLTGHDRAPDRIAMGRQGEQVSIGRDEKVHLEESHVNAHGERVTVAVRYNGPHAERFRIREVQVGPHTRMITEHFGGH